MKISRFKIGAVISLGFLAPLWWSWTLGQLMSVARFLSGSTALWLVIVIPSVFLGFVTGAIVTALLPEMPVTAWAIFMTAWLGATVVLGALFNTLPSFLIESISNQFNLTVLAAALLIPLITQVRRHYV